MSGATYPVTIVSVGLSVNFWRPPPNGLFTLAGTVTVTGTSFMQNVSHYTGIRT